MKNITLGIAIVFLVLAFTACGNQNRTDASAAEGMSSRDETSADTDEMPAVTLTQPLLDQYLETLPPFIQKAKDIGENVNTIGAAQLGGGELAALLQEKGWADPEEFGEINAKVMMLTPWLMASQRLEGQSAETKKMVAEQFDTLFKSAGVSEAEKQLLVANQDKLMTALEKADM
jgi:hypothetical protein